MGTSSPIALRPGKGLAGLMRKAWRGARGGGSPFSLPEPLPRGFTRRGEASPWRDAGRTAAGGEWMHLLRAQGRGQEGTPEPMAWGAERGKPGRALQTAELWGGHWAPVSGRRQQSFLPGVVRKNAQRAEMERFGEPRCPARGLKFHSQVSQPPPLGLLLARGGWQSSGPRPGHPPPAHPLSKRSR